MKRFKITALISIVVLALAGAYILGQNSNSAEPQILTAKIDGQDYIVGSVTDGVQEIDQMAIFALLLANAEDQGIKRAAEAIGFRGPMSIQELQSRQTQGETPDDP